MYVIFLPTGGLQPEGNTWTVKGTSGQPRCDKVAWQYFKYKRQDTPVTILISGGVTGSVRNLSGSHYHKQYLVNDKGIPESDILLEESSKLSTEKVGCTVNGYCSVLRQSKIIIVSQLIHSLRLNISFRLGYGIRVWKRAPSVSWRPHSEGWYEIPGLIVTLLDSRGEGFIFQWIRRFRLS